MRTPPSLALPLQTSQWFNTDTPLQLSGLHGQVVVLHTFQMLCPGCVSHGVPQATRIHDAFADSGVVVIGLHTVFEHHAVMNADALRVFIHENGLEFPIAIDEPGVQGGMPRTMQAYGLKGTPSLVLIDKHGRVRLQHFGHLDDLRAGFLIGQLLQET